MYFCGAQQREGHARKDEERVEQEHERMCHRPYQSCDRTRRQPRERLHVEVDQYRAERHEKQILAFMLARIVIPGLSLRKDLVECFAYALTDLSEKSSDHGKKRNEWLAAQSKAETAARERQEQRRDTELDITQTVAEVNQRQAMVDDTRHSLQIAEDAYTAMLQRFIRGQATVNDLSLAQQYWQEARRDQITALQDFWNSYYHLRQLTLYDFIKHQPIHH